jgi:phage terminase small subunit
MNTIQPIDDAPMNNETNVQSLDDGLTEKQRRFVDAYIGDARFNATEAAQIAGYAGDRNTLHAMGSENLRKPTILAYMRARAMAVMSTHELMEQLAQVIRRDEMEYAQEYRNKLGHVVAVRIDLNGKVKAIELMMKAHGMLTEKVEHSGTVEQQIKQVIVHLNATPAADQQTEREIPQ